MNPSPFPSSTPASPAKPKRGGRASAMPASTPPASTPATQNSTPPSPLGAALGADTSAVVVAIPASPEFVRVVRLAVAGVATRMRFSYEQIEDIKLAVSEACNNAILHAHPASGGAPTQVVVRIRPGEDRLEVTVFDQGHLPDGALDLDATASPWRGLGDVEDLPEGGMGLMLIQSLMDEVSSHVGAPDHTALHMVKRTRPL